MENINKSLLLKPLGLIQKALKLVKKVEDLGEKRKKIQETKRKSKTTDKTDIGSSARNSINIVDKISKKIEELKVGYCFVVKQRILFKTKILDKCRAIEWLFSINYMDVSSVNLYIKEVRGEFFF